MASGFIDNFMLNPPYARFEAVGSLAGEAIGGIAGGYSGYSIWEYAFDPSMRFSLTSGTARSSHERSISNATREMSSWGPLSPAQVSMARNARRTASLSASDEQA